MGSYPVTSEDCFYLMQKDHPAKLGTLFYNFYQAKIFTDMSLSCQGQTIRCHKIVLASASRFIEMLLAENQGGDPTVILQAISFSALEKVIEYMYKGEVTLKQDELDGFLQAAKKLEVKGFVDQSGESTVPGLFELSPKEGLKTTIQDVGAARMGVEIPASSRAVPVPMPGSIREREKKYTSKDLENAIQCVSSGMCKASSAARAFNIPYSTLTDNLKKRGISTKWA